MSSVTTDARRVCGESKPSRARSGLKTSTSASPAARARLPISRWRSATAASACRRALREIFFADAAEVGAQETRGAAASGVPATRCARLGDDPLDELRRALPGMSAEKACVRRPRPARA